jgi:hypothetical protein
MLPFVGCVFRVPVKGLSKSRGTCDGAGADVCLVALCSTAAVMVAQLGALLRAPRRGLPSPAPNTFPTYPPRCPATPQRTPIPYPEDPEPCYVQSVTVRAVDAGWSGSGKPLTVVILPVRRPPWSACALPPLP